MSEIACSRQLTLWGRIMSPRYDGLTLLHLEVCTGILRDGVATVFQYSHRLKRGNRVTPYGKVALLIMLGASAAQSSLSPPQAADATADATKVVDIEVPTLGPAQDPLGIKTSATEFPCGGLRPVAHTGTTEGAPRLRYSDRNTHGESSLEGRQGLY
jgi:hypothetical protein